MSLQFRAFVRAVIALALTAAVSRDASAQSTAPPVALPTNDAPKGELPPLLWRSTPFTTGDYVTTAAGGVVTLVAAIVAPQPKHAIGGVLFDDTVRKGLRIGDLNGRFIARDISDVGLSLIVTWPVFVDSLITAWWYRGSREVAQQTALIDLETLAISGAVQGITNVAVSRERPYSRDCGTSALPANAIDCDGTSRQRSFFSGHSAFSFTSAALICTHHMRNELLGGPFDAASCVAGYAVATTTATMRVVGDMHYATDVISGAIVGTAIGYGVPWLHYRHKGMTVESTGFNLKLVPAANGAAVVGVF